MHRRLAVAIGFLTTLVGAFLDRRGLGDWTLERRLDAWTVGVVVLAAVAALLALVPVRRVRVAGTALDPLGLVGVGVGVVLVVAVGKPLPPAPCPDPTTVVAGPVIAVCRGPVGSSATVHGGPPIPLSRIAADGYGLEPLSSGVRVVPAPGAVVVAGTSGAAPVVQGLS